MRLETVLQLISVKSWRIFRPYFRRQTRTTWEHLQLKSSKKHLTTCDRYPQVKLYLNNKQMSSLVDLPKESKGDVAKEAIELNVAEFKSALSQVDSQMKNLPATAQLSKVPILHLADCFNRMEECTTKPEGPIRFRESGRHRFRPFRYKHLGQFAPLGGEQTEAQLPGDWVAKDEGFEVPPPGEYAVGMYIPEGSKARLCLQNCSVTRAHGSRLAYCPNR
ncbi:putative NADH:ubiquinone reductase (non-electrogenic) [Helianthus annuus]|uniref:NADH:ubiquinone reductase (Non-electrogenic) n=1 Tax=Helianthus annuus TaxID=4232 RepID=A0A9K3J321_HELAN|nr:putative NADH:ubiquinone reductase (non-electrogenic) [Helianthus annuus]KAJ0920620.1 putative NADH:ubiquinone reductase (non-electrogenic) [Helianthus annuus]KAJ0924231.1 putative NADH:ubiquinone reductase (non-electrogenic) [Helianthus annuus]